MRRLKFIVVILVLLVPAGHALAQAVGTLAYVTMEPSRIKVGESTIIRITSFNRLKDVTLPTVPGLVFENLGRSEGFDFINGAAISASFIQIRVTAQFAGLFSIPGLIPGAHALGLEVVTGNEPNPYAWRSQEPAPLPVTPVSLPKNVQLQAGGGAFVRLAIPSRTIYVGESVPIEIQVGLRPGIVTTVNGLPTLQGGDFTFNNLSRQPERREQAIEGDTFVVLTWHSAIAAVKPGEFSLSAEAPLTAKISTLSAADTAVASRLSFPLLQNLYSSIASRELTIQSATSTLRVLPLPSEGQPEHFSGAVGEFRVSSDITPANVAAGEPVNLRLHVSGSGNFDRVDSTMLEHLDHWKTYPAKSSFTPSDAVGYEGEKVFEQPLIASQAGEQTIPGLEFGFFNPSTRRYERLQTPAITVNVAASLASGSLTALTGTGGLSAMRNTGSAPGLRADHPASRHPVSELTPLYFRLPFLAIPTTLALLLAGSTLVFSPRAARASAKATERVLAQLEAAAQADEASAFLEAARQVLLRSHAARWRMSVDEITVAELRARLGPASKDVEELLVCADEARYSPSRPGSVEYRRWLGLIRAQLTREGI